MTKGRKDYSKKVAIEKTYTITNGLVLPDNVRRILTSLDGKTDALVRNSYIAALRYAGWTLQSIGDATGVSRERIRQIESTTSMELVEQIKMFPNEFPIPALPTETVIEYKYEAYEPNPETLARLLELQPLAQQVRSHSPRYRAEAEEYAALLWKAHNEESVTLYHLAKLLGVTHGALRFRLVRYGYMKPAKGGNSRAYQPIINKNRVAI
jgi:transcriptional regulator with XRE-family HTH domain